VNATSDSRTSFSVDSRVVRLVCPRRERETLTSTSAGTGASPSVWTRLVVVLLLGVAATAVAAEPLCPAGEITLTPGELRMGPGNGQSGSLIGTGSTFVLPAGVTIDPAGEPVVFALEVDRQEVASVALPPGALVPLGRSGFAYRHRGSELSLHRVRGAYRLGLRLRDLDLRALRPPPPFVKQILKIGDDCFTAMLACTREHGGVLCRSDRTARLAGRVTDAAGGVLTGTMMTLLDDVRLETVSVFVQEDGHYVFPPVRPGAYRLRARLIGYEDVVQDDVVLAADRFARRDVVMAPTADVNAQLPASAWFSLLLDKWPDPRIRGDFTLSCGNCHQIGAYRFRRAKTEDEWREVLAEMMLNLPPYFPETRERLVDTVIGVFGPAATIPPLPVPPRPSGEVLRAVLHEYVIGTAAHSPGCHDLELGADGRVYSDSGLRWIDPRTGERGIYPFTGDSHSIERAPDGSMWITQAGDDSLAQVFVDGVTPPRYFPLPVIDGVQGAYPHTHRVEANGQLWMTLAKSNQIASFDPATETWAYYALPEADPVETGLSIPVPYGLDIAPDGTIWWSQLFGQRIGRYDPATDTMRAWRPPFWGPRRLAVGRDGIVWVPGYGAGVLGRFDPAIERWKTYPLPTGVPGPPGFGTSEAPYNLNANRNDGMVWVNGSNSDTLIRFDPTDEHFAVFPLPTRASFTREIEFDPDNNVWTCTSNEPAGPDERGRGKFVELELPPPDAACGNHRLEPGEECDDGNLADCDGCSARCRIETGCGDGAVCDGEECDDGNTTDCDGCSATCRRETGLLCGDGILNATCGEQCEPPVPGRCDDTCQRIPFCGDGTVDPGEACDDGDLNGTPGHCGSTCALPGCGDGVLDPGEACDDGNAVACDGCSPTCELEVGSQCGDGIVNAACGEECDPPGEGVPECNYLCGLGPAAPLGTRRLAFGGALYSSALGTGVALGTPEGTLELAAGAPDVDGHAAVSVAGPTYFRVPILGGSFGYLCGRITSCTGEVACSGGVPADVLVEQDSQGSGLQGEPPVTTTGLGAAGPPGTVQLTCGLSTIQVDPPEPDCATQAYPPDQPTVFTTGLVTARFLNAHATIGTGEIAATGEPFDCAEWAASPGPGALLGAFLQEEAPQAGDTANLLLFHE
jgi:virginiamycin B lyase